MPLVSKTFDQLLDFTRTSSATFVGSNGLIQNTAASRNLLTFTQQFDNAAWTKTNTTVTANSTVAPDGTNTADTLTDDATNGHHRINTSGGLTATIPYAISIYAKAGTHNFIQLLATSGGGSNGWFTVIANLATGAITQTGNGSSGTLTSSSITSVGDGWYRIAMVGSASTASAQVRIAMVPAASGNTLGTTDGTVSYAGTGTSLFIWGAQLEAAATATTYTRNNGGVFPPRFDYDPVTLAPKGILIEEQRTNLALNSTLFTSTNWAKIDASLTTGIDDPAGGTSATTLTATAAFGTIQQAAISTAGTYSVSIWIKRRTGTGQVSLRCGDLTLIPITVTSSWVRYTATAVATTTTIRLAVVLTTSGDEVDIWGGQIEAGAFATSYIPTAGASTVTRTADSCAIVAPNFAPWYNQSEGTFVFSGDSAYGAGGMIGSTPTTGAILYSTTFDAKTFNGTASVATAAPYYTANTPFKATMAYSAAGRAVVLNGGTVASDANLIQTPTAIMLGSAFGGGFLNGHVRSIRYYPTRLTNAQLQALTA